MLKTGSVHQRACPGFKQHNTFHCKVAVADVIQTVSWSCGQNIGFKSFLMIKIMQCPDVRGFQPDRECLTSLTDLLGSLWPTARKVKETMD